jgi:hypothetical protein
MNRSNLFACQSKNVSFPNITTTVQAEPWAEGHVARITPTRLIGMDVITKGDFCVSTVNDETVFSFRMPAQGITIE